MPRRDFNQTIGSFNFQDPAGVLSRIAESEGRQLVIEDLTVVDVGGGGHTPPQMMPFMGKSRVISFDGSNRSLKSVKELHQRRVLRRTEIINVIVTPANMNGLLRARDVPYKFALLKIDIDSVDCEIMAATLSEHRPTVVHIETNPAFPPPIRFNMKWVPNVQHLTGSPTVLYGCSLSYATDVAASFGYSLLQAPIEDSLFVQKEHLNLFKDIVRSQREIYRIGNPFLYSFQRFGKGVSEEWMKWPAEQQHRKELLRRVLGNVTRQARDQSIAQDEMDRRFHVGIDPYLPIQPL